MMITLDDEHGARRAWGGFDVGDGGVVVIVVAEGGFVGCFGF
jgi:hypothetical protein